MDEDGHVIEYVEKPDVPRSNLVSMGIYIFNKDILIKRLIEDAGESASVHDFGYSILPGMVGKTGFMLTNLMTSGGILAQLKLTILRVWKLQGQNRLYL